MTIDRKKSAVFGAAFGVAAVLATVAVHWLASRPEDWDSSSITCGKQAIVQAFDIPAFSSTGEPEHFVGSGFDLEFILQNHTRNEYTVPRDLKIFARDDRSSALSQLKVTFDHPYVIPGKDRAEVDVTVEYSCGIIDLKTGKKTAQECFNDQFGHVAGLVGFDHSTHTRLDLPRPTFSKDAAAAATALGR